MFSSRTDWKLRDNGLATLLHQMRSSGVDLIDLTDSNPTRCGLTPPPGFVDQLADSQVLAYQPDPKGLFSARRAIAEYYEQQGAAVDPESIFLTSSTSEAYSFLFRLLCNPGDRILVPRPGYPLFDLLAGLNDLEVDGYRLTYDGEWYIDRDSLTNGIHPRTRAIILIHPSNPAGSYVKEEERRFLFNLASQHGIPLIVDEVFHACSVDPGWVAGETFAGTTAVPTVVLSGLSKLAGLPQLKLAWMSLTGPEPWLTEALSRLEVISDTFLSVSTPAQIVLPAILRNFHSYLDPIVARIRENYSALCLSVPAHCTLFRCEGGWSAMMRVPATKNDEQWAMALLNEQKVLVYPGDFFEAGKEPYFVLSLLPPPALFQEAIQRLVRFFAAFAQ